MYKRLIISLGITLLILPVFVFAAECPNLYPSTGSTHSPQAGSGQARNLSFGSRGQDVVELQNFLIAQGDLAAGNNTGYFGKLTEAAVKSFQKRNDIVSSGTPKTTGYGAVGPKTRAKIARVCAGSGSAATSVPVSSAPVPSAFQPQCPLVDLPIGKPCNGSWKEVKDTNGCTASWQCQ